ncbi:MAG: hypothetical protein JW801_10230 [Bacteroidales bacterium]|nr:hypothetical protein [Bacteroidales bacterium]
MIEIKGTAVTAIRDHVKANFPEKYSEWIETLPEASKDIFSGVIDSSRWYPLQEGGIIPTRKTADLFFRSNYEKGAWEGGRYSAEKGLTGIYKIFVKASSPAYIIQRATRVFSTYYQPCKMEVIDKKENAVSLKISDMPQSDVVIEHRIAGWMERALEISGAKQVRIEFPKSIVKGDEVTVFSISWES